MKTRFSVKRAQGEMDSERVFRTWLSTATASNGAPPTLLDDSMSTTLASSEERDTFDTTRYGFTAFIENSSELYLRRGKLRRLRDGLNKLSGFDTVSFEEFTAIFWQLKDVDKLSRDAYWLTATLFPWGTLESGKKGAADFASAVKSELFWRADGDAKTRFSRRWQQILHSDIASLGVPLSYLIRQLHHSKKPVSINWPRLLRDLIEWRKAGQPVQNRWRQNGPSIARFQNLKNSSPKENMHAGRDTFVAKSKSF